MNSASLERWQVERLLKRVDQELQFLVKLEGRMHQKHFPINDSVFENVKSARNAINPLAIELHRLLPPSGRTPDL
jgi:hypothetical protein